jgi:hypothetical protein
VTDAPIVVVAEKGDFHAKAVAAVLRKEHGIDPVLVDTAAFLDSSASFTLSSARPSSKLAGTDLSEARSVWWRRSPPCEVPQGVNRSHNEYRQAECDGFVQGLLWAVPALWVNDPGAERVASRKLVQLQAAQVAGLAVPATLVTNDPDRAAEFIQGRTGRTIYKRTGTSYAEFSETRLVEAEDLERLESIRTSPTTFQDYVEGESDLRVVWVAGTSVAVRIDSQSGSGKVDSRLDNSVAFTQYQLSAGVDAALGRCMRSLGLLFGVVDLRVGVDGVTYFLEVNPEGQFAYLEFKAGSPMFSTLADLLADPSRVGARLASE